MRHSIIGESGGIDKKGTGSKLRQARRARFSAAIHLRLQSAQDMQKKGYQIFLEALTWKKMADHVREAIGKTTPEIRELRIQANKLAYMTHEVLGPDHAIRMRARFTIPKGAAQKWKKPGDKRNVMVQYTRTLSVADKVMGIWLPDCTKSERRLLVSIVSDVLSGTLSKRKIKALMGIKVPTRTGRGNRPRPTR